MDRLRIYDYLTTTRGMLFDAIRPLDDAAWTRRFEIGAGTLGRVLTHIMISEWYYLERIGGRDVPLYELWPIRYEDPPEFSEVERVWTSQAERIRGELADVSDWDAPVRYQTTLDDGRVVRVATTKGDIFTQLVMHEPYHRAQLMNILRHLGVEAPDMDYNLMTMDIQEVRV